MYGIVIEYNYSGDEQEWRTTIDQFLANIEADDRLRGKFRYQVTRAMEGDGRIHIGRWDSDETLAHLQSQPFFAEFAGKVKGFAGGPPRATKFEQVAATGSA